MCRNTDISVTGIVYVWCCSTEENRKLSKCHVLWFLLQFQTVQFTVLLVRNLMKQQGIELWDWNLVTFLIPRYSWTAFGNLLLFLLHIDPPTPEISSVLPLQLMVATFAPEHRTQIQTQPSRQFTLPSLGTPIPWSDSGPRWTLVPASKLWTTKVTASMLNSVPTPGPSACQIEHTDWTHTTPPATWGRPREVSSSRISLKWHPPGTRHQLDRVIKQVCSN